MAPCAAYQPQAQSERCASQMAAVATTPILHSALFGCGWMAIATISAGAEGAPPRAPCVLVGGTLSPGHVEWQLPRACPVLLPRRGARASFGRHCCFERSAQRPQPAHRWHSQCSASAAVWHEGVGACNIHRALHTTPAICCWEIAASCIAVSQLVYMARHHECTTRKASSRTQHASRMQSGMVEGARALVASGACWPCRPPGECLRAFIASQMIKVSHDTWGLAALSAVQPEYLRQLSVTDSPSVQACAAAPPAAPSRERCREVRPGVACTVCAVHMTIAARAHASVQPLSSSTA